MLKIRLMRIGTKKRPFYRVVVVDERAKRTGAYVELLGTYNPLTKPKEIKLDKEKIAAWIKKGAQPSVGYLRMIGKAPQRPPRKPKKEQKKEEPAPTAPVEAEAPEKPVPETPGEAATEQPSNPSVPSESDATPKEKGEAAAAQEGSGEPKKDEGSA